MIGTIFHVIRTAALVVFLGAVAGSPARAAETPTETALFAGGCFWCLEDAFEHVPGVVSAISGYTGGERVKPTYEQVSHGGAPGHYEAVQIVFDPARISYERLLTLFWRNIDPLQDNGQFCDHGPQYRAAIFPRTPAQRAAAEASKAALIAEKRFDRPIVTEIVEAKPFYPAEDYHQDYAEKNPLKYQFYRYNCGRDQQLDQRWGAEARGGVKH